MNELQLAKQLRYLLRSRTWPDAGGALIWSNRVHCSNGMPEDQYTHLGSPAVLVGVNDSEADSQSPGYRRQIFTLTYWCQVAGDVRGENALIGANRTNGALSSSGRGILEYTEELSRTLRQIQETLGVKIVARHTSDVGTGIVKGLGYVAMRQMVIEAKCSDLRYYHPPLRVAVANLGGGQMRVTWVDPPDRFDGSGRTLFVRYKAGSAPTSDTDGTLGATVARGVQTATFTTGAGTWFASVFAGYTDSGAAANERFSEGPATEEGISGSVTVT